MGRKELFVGNLSRDVQKRDIEDVFDRYGRLIRCDVKDKGMGNPFCFLEFEDERDAEVI
jgi:RNA recognition motif-containing protein